MKSRDSRSKPEAPKNRVKKPFKDMTRSQKFVFVCQVVVCIISFGFIFPNLMS